LGDRGPKSKNLRTTFCRVPHGKQLTAKNGSIALRNKKRRSNLKERDRQTESMTKNNRVLARRGDQKKVPKSVTEFVAVIYVAGFLGS